MRWTAWLLLAACGTTGLGTAPPAAPPIVTHDDILPAGMYFRRYIYSSCPECDPPKAAAVVGVYATAAEAERAAARVPSVALGYPMIVHSEELGITFGGRSGVLVIAALLPREDAPSPVPGARVVPVSAPDVNEAGEKMRLVVRIDAGGPAPAYDPKVAEGDYDIDDPNVGEPLKEVKPLCQVPAGAAFVTTLDKLDWYRFAPVRCPDGRAALVPWHRTLVAATIIPQPRSGYRLMQVVGAMCDSPSYREWPYGPQGRRRSLPFAPAGCLGLR